MCSSWSTLVSSVIAECIALTHQITEIPSVIHNKQYLCKNSICFTFNSKFYYLSSSTALFFIHMDTITLISTSRFLRVWDFFKLLYIESHLENWELQSIKIVVSIHTTVLQQGFFLLADLWVQSSKCSSWIYLLTSTANTLQVIKADYEAPSSNWRKMQQIMTNEYGRLCTSANIGLILNITHLTLSLHIAFGLTANLRFKSSDILNHFINTGSATDSHSILWSSHLYSPYFSHPPIESFLLYQTGF